MIGGSRLGRLREDRRGIAATEFAIIAPVFFLMMTGLLEFGYWFMVRSMAIGTLEQVARGAGVGGAAVNPATFEAQVESKIKNIAPSATFVWTKRSYYEFAGVGKPEKLVDDKDGDGRYDNGDCWEDLITNNVFDANPGRAGIGGADDILHYTLQVTHKPLFRLSGFIPGFPATRVTTIKTLVKRQPYAAQTIPPVRC